MQIIPLSEGSFTIDKSKLFIPFEPGTDNLQARSAGSLLVEIQPFAIITSQDILLLDTGLGFQNDGILQIHQNLAEHNIDPSQVTKVLMTHLHKDHAGGVGRREDDNKPETLAFPNATYYVQKGELDAAFESQTSSYIQDELAVLKDNPRVVLLEGNGVLDGYIKYQVTSAHSPHHQVFWVVDSGEKVFFGGDDAPQLHQMKNRFVAKYDFDGKKCMELRQQWWKQGEAEKWTFLFYHDIKTPVFNF